MLHRFIFFVCDRRATFEISINFYLNSGTESEKIKDLNVAYLHDIYLFTKLKARITRQNYMTIDGSIGSWNAFQSKIKFLDLCQPLKKLLTEQTHTYTHITKTLPLPIHRR